MKNKLSENVSKSKQTNKQKISKNENYVSYINHANNTNMTIMILLNCFKRCNTVFILKKA